MCSQIKIDELTEARSKLLAQMKKLENKSLHCGGCPAPCCTFHYNSMRITKAEGLALVNYLVTTKHDLIALKEKCHLAIQEFRLDKDFFMKADTRLRHHYTCPLFNNHELGCSIPPEHKPLGCLAFNPTDAIQKGQTCRSLAYSGSSDNQKLEIPRAILVILENVIGVS